MSSPFDFYTREKALRKRALAVLGFTEEEGRLPLPDRRELLYRYHCRMLAYHPDVTADAPHSNAFAALINEAFALLAGRRVQPTLLRNDSIVELFLQTKPDPLQDVPSYEQWLQEHFFDMETNSIWSY